MRFKVITATALVALAALSACSSGGSKSGVMAGRTSLDEFAVSKRAPLTIPPDFTLAPPRPGAPRPQEADSSQQALSALFGDSAPRRSQTEKDIIGLTKTLPEPGIRSAADAKTVMVDKGAATRNILAAASTNSDVASVSLGN